MGYGRTRALSPIYSGPLLSKCERSRLRIRCYQVSCPLALKTRKTYSKPSFDSLKTWIAECEKHGLTADAEIPRILIGNKCDLVGNEKVLMDVAQVGIL